MVLVRFCRSEKRYHIEIPVRILIEIDYFFLCCRIDQRVDAVVRRYAYCSNKRMNVILSERLDFDYSDTLPLSDSGAFVRLQDGSPLIFVLSRLSPLYANSILRFFSSLRSEFPGKSDSKLCSYSAEMSLADYRNLNFLIRTFYDCHFKFIDDVSL